VTGQGGGRGRMGKLVSVVSSAAVSRGVGRRQWWGDKTNVHNSYGGGQITQGIKHYNLTKSVQHLNTFKMALENLQGVSC